MPHTKTRRAVQSRPTTNNSKWQTRKCERQHTVIELIQSRRFCLVTIVEDSLVCDTSNTMNALDALQLKWTRFIFGRPKLNTYPTRHTKRAERARIWLAWRVPLMYRYTCLIFTPNNLFVWLCARECLFDVIIRVKVIRWTSGTVIVATWEHFRFVSRLLLFRLPRWKEGEFSLFVRAHHPVAMLLNLRSQPVTESRLFTCFSCQKLQLHWVFGREFNPISNS